ncbi:hypothetical protein ERUR111494_02195 [Erysipelothrix urinaevulpis]|uniref:hypothetical protein n=1 Tax=Erysipelothrix urinaevulpis TaxID=2683717 RepID=UPI001915C179|nr:hypothetical protein [Erysipelothrix urinaevulpis]
MLFLLNKKIKGKEIVNSKILEDFLTKCRDEAKNSPLLGKNFTLSNVDYWYKSVLGALKNTDDIFVFFDHLNLGNWEILISGLDLYLQNEVFTTLKKHELNLNTGNICEFLIRFKVLREIRNCVSHRNSIEILIRYRNVRKNSLRYAPESRKYRRLFDELKISDKFIDIYT